MEGESVEYRSLRRRRDHVLRREALELSRGVCAVCDVDFTAVLDGRGVRVLQVHHRKQLAQLKAPRVNTVRDLAVVCANCHALIHSDPKRSIPVEELKRQLVSANRRRG
jgi:predicted HNH restriction endonuclease